MEAQEDVEEEDEEFVQTTSKKRKAPAKSKAPASKKAKGKGKEEEDGADGADGGAEETKKSISSSFDFSLPQKLPNHLKVVSWNVAGFKSIMGKGFVEYLTAEDPDIICLQETKMAEELALKTKLPAGYHAFFYTCESKKGYAGTGLLSKEKPIAVTRGIGTSKHDSEGRCITAEFEKFYLVTTYVPNSGKKLDRLSYRVKEWDIAFLKYLKTLEEKKPVIWCGDLNVAHQEIDLKNPKTNKRTAGFTQEERDSFTNILASGFVDSFRHFNPTQEGAYTFWSYKGGARDRDVGWRLDYFVISKAFMESVVDSVIRKTVLGSDHCPIVLLLNN